MGRGLVHGMCQTSIAKNEGHRHERDHSKRTGQAVVSQHTDTNFPSCLQPSYAYGKYFPIFTLQRENVTIDRVFCDWIATRQSPTPRTSFFPCLRWPSHLLEVLSSEHLWIGHAPEPIGRGKLIWIGHSTLREISYGQCTVWPLNCWGLTVDRRLLANRLIGLLLGVTRETAIHSRHSIPPTTRWPCQLRVPPISDASA